MLRALALLLSLMALPASAETVTVFAASSLKTALDAIAPGFEAATGHELRLSYAGSSALARQIEQGAPADVFISANPGWMDRIDEAGLLMPDSRIDLLGNRLVLIAHRAAGPVTVSPDMNLTAMLGDGRLAMALVDAVPAGIYGKAALTSLGLWDGIAPQVAQADNVRAALALVAIGEAPLGIVYATDAKAEPRVSVIATFPEGSHPPITYPAAVLKEGQTGPASELLSYLSNPAARDVFEAQGFTVLGD